MENIEGFACNALRKMVNQSNGFGIQSLRRSGAAAFQNHFFKLESRGRILLRGNFIRYPQPVKGGDDLKFG
jgi:hypothetical protein